MPNPLQATGEIVPLLFNRKFLLAYGTKTLGGRQSEMGYWNHVTGSWVVTPDEATAFDTYAGSLVYRRGNLQRMQIALDDMLPQS